MSCTQNFLPFKLIKIKRILKLKLIITLVSRQGRSEGKWPKRRSIGLTPNRHVVAIRMVVSIDDQPATSSRTTAQPRPVAARRIEYFRPMESSQNREIGFLKTCLFEIEQEKKVNQTFSAFFDTPVVEIFHSFHSLST